jgi:hypothetical protein
MRHLLLGAVMLVGALAVTSIATTALETRATARAATSNYEPPALVASPAYSKKTDGVLTGVQRARPRVTPAVIDQRV